jgi:hypothetical protein
MKYLILILIITLASCAGPTLLTKEGGQVRQISINEAKQCDFIEVIVTRDRGPSSGQALSDARNDLRNIIAEKGGNAFTLLDEHKDGWVDCLLDIRCGANVEAQAYSCPNLR